MSYRLAILAAATLALAAPQLEAYPYHLEPDDMCTSSYSSWLALSTISGGMAYCMTEFPVSTPVCATVTETADHLEFGHTKTVTVPVVTHTTCPRTTSPCPKHKTTSTSCTKTKSPTTSCTKTKSPTTSCTKTSSETYTISPLAKRYRKAHKHKGKKKDEVASATGHHHHLLAKLEHMSHRDEASTICGCIQANPSCTTTTVKEYVTKTGHCTETETVAATTVTVSKC